MMSLIPNFELITHGLTKAKTKVEGTHSCHFHMIAAPLALASSLTLAAFALCLEVRLSWHAEATASTPSNHASCRRAHQPSSNSSWLAP